jgi:hypothetical protein
MPEAANGERRMVNGDNEIVAQPFAARHLPFAIRRMKA